MALYAAGYSLRWDLNTAPYDATTVRIAQRDDQNRIKELYQIAADACYAVMKQKENDLLENYEDIFRNLATKEYNKETMLESPLNGFRKIITKGGNAAEMPVFHGEPDFIQKGSFPAGGKPCLYQGIHPQYLRLDRSRDCRPRPERPGQSPGIGCQSNESVPCV